MFLLISTLLSIIFIFSPACVPPPAEKVEEEAAEPPSVSDEPSQPAIEGAFPENYFIYFDLPQLTNSERLKLATQARANWDEYCRQADARAREFSDRLEDYIRAWLRGEASATLPEGLLPPYIDGPKTHHWTLIRPGDVEPEQQWLIQAPAHEIDPEFNNLYMFGVDRHVTYVKLIFIAPLNSRLLIEGDFPHARFMD
jgi:hypothetical protein